MATENRKGKTMRGLLVVVILLGLGAAAFSANKHVESKKVWENKFIDREMAIIKAHAQILQDEGRMPDNFMTFSVLGTYNWHDGWCEAEPGFHPASKCYFGAYSFSQAAFDQAKRSWWIDGQMPEGSDLLINVGHGEFDKSVVGYSVGYLTYCSLHGGKLYHCDDKGFPGGKVIEFIDKKTLRLDKKAKWDADMHGVGILPPDYVDMCNCTNNFNPMTAVTAAEN